MSVKDFYTKKLEEIKQDGRKILDSQGKPPFIKFAQGVTEFHIENKEFDVITSYQKQRAVFMIVIQEEDKPVNYSWAITMTSPLFRQVCGKLANAKEGAKFVSAVINRFGTGTQTRYELIE